MNRAAIALKGISKSFPGVKALDQIDLSFFPGEIHAVVGENGAGKSTLMKILAGDYSKDEGEIVFFGRPVELNSSRKAQHMGIGMIHQELTLLPDRSIAENIMLGREPRGLLGLVDKRAMTRSAREHLKQLGLDLDPSLMVSSLPIAMRQMVEIAKALSLNAKILILDEPTSSLSGAETNILLSIVRSLRDKGITLIYISHRLEEVFATADRITVLRDGHLIATKDAAETNLTEVVRMMVGRELTDAFNRRTSAQSEVLLNVDGLTGRGFQNISLRLHRGEVLGVSGLVGAGRSEFARALVGLDPLSSGKAAIEGNEIRHLEVRDTISKGLVYVPEDRKEQGLFLNLSVQKNLTVNVLKLFSRWGVLDFKRIRELAAKLVDRLNVHLSNLSDQIRNLSGGNQQKVVIAKWLSTKPKILVLDEPTRGIDVGAKAEIYTLIDQLAADGAGIIVISSELPEILGLSDRILVMRNGEMVGEFSRGEATQDGIMHLAAGAVS